MRSGAVAKESTSSRAIDGGWSLPPKVDCGQSIINEPSDLVHGARFIGANMKQKGRWYE